METTATDIELFTSIIGEAVKDRETRLLREESSDREYRYAFVPNGTLIVRFYIETYADKEGKKRGRIVRKYWIHRIKDIPVEDGKTKTFRILCGGDGCRLCAQASRLYDIELANAWTYASHLEGNIKVFIFETKLEDQNDVKYAEPNTQSVLVLKKAGINALDDFLAELAPADAARVLSMEAPNIGIKLKHWYENGLKFSCSFEPLKNYTLPPIDPKMPANMDTIFPTDADTLKEEDFVVIERHVSKLIASKLNNQDPDTVNLMSNNPVPAEATKVATPISAPLAAVVATPAATAATNIPAKSTNGATTEGVERCRGIAEGAEGYGVGPGQWHFGAPPSHVVHKCLLCKSRTPCKEAEQATGKAA